MPSSWSARRFIGLASVTVILLLGLPALAAATFSGSNGKIYYGMSVAGSSETDIFSIDPDGSNGLDITAENGFSEERPAVSPNGQQVVFQSFRDGGWNIFKVNADGSGATDLTNTKHPEVVNFEPTWSADGTKVAFMRQRQTEQDQDIWVVNADGTNPVDITEGSSNDESAPEFSPDGSKIVYVAAGPLPCCSVEYNNEIWVMNANGTGQTQLTFSNGPIQNIAPTWSADGTKIAFSRTETAAGIDNGVHVMDANGANETRLLPGGSPVLANTLAWSPDGAKIAYEGGGGIRTMNADGSGIVPVVTSGNPQYPSWAPTAVTSSSGAGAGAAGPGSSPGAPGPAVPSNKFAFGKAKLNQKKGTATLAAILPGAGSLVLTGKGVKKVTTQVKGPGQAILTVKAIGGAGKTLSRTGAVKLTLNVSFTPSGGSPNTLSHGLRLKKR